MYRFVQSCTSTYCYTVGRYRYLLLQLVSRNSSLDQSAESILVRLKQAYFVHLTSLRIL